MTPQDQPNHINQLKYILDAVRENQSHERAGITDDEAIQAIKAYFLDLIGEDESYNSTRIIWEGNGGVRAENADDFRAQIHNRFRAELREKLK